MERMIGGKKHGRGQWESSRCKTAPGGATKYETSYEDDLGVESGKEGALTIEVSCTPHGSKLRKPKDFLKTAFANILEPYVEGFDVESVSYVKDDTFLVKTSMKYADGKCMG